jgi:hypothetical protein
MSKEKGKLIFGMIYSFQKMKYTKELEELDEGKRAVLGK